MQVDQLKKTQFVAGCRFNVNFRALHGAVVKSLLEQRRQRSLTHKQKNRRVKR